MSLPARDHLHRLSNVWIKSPVYFLTICVDGRRKLLANPPAAGILIGALRDPSSIHGWVVGRYVIMPEHVHFFASPKPDAKPLGSFIRDWKKWTTRKLHAAGFVSPIVWQPEFFDHVLRSVASYEEKWNYVRDNPVRAGLVASVEAWPYAGECETLFFRTSS